MGGWASRRTQTAVREDGGNCQNASEKSVYKSTEKGREKRMKKSLLSVLMLVMIFSSACASGNKDGNEASPTGSASAAPAQTSAAPTETATETAAEREKLSLFFFIDGPGGARLPTGDADFVKSAIEKKFNVELKVEYMDPGADYVAKVNALLLSNQAPDMWRDANGDGGQKLILDGIIADMTTAVTPETMPAYFKYWTNEDELKRYQVHGQFARAPIPFNRNVYRAYYIRKDWLDRLGMDIPDTYDEYYAALQAFRNDDPDGNGLKDTYGISFDGNGDSIGLDWPEYVKYGLTFPSYADENFNFIDMQTDLRVEQVINDIIRINAEDLIDPDWFLNKAPQATEKAIQGKVGIVMGNTVDFATDANPTGLQVQSQALNPNADWVPFTPFPNEALRTAISPGGPFLFAKTVADKNPEKIARSVEILDWLAGEEGFLMTHYGVEGKHYTRDGDTITLIPEAYEAEIRNQGNFLEVWDFFTPPTPEVLGLKVVDPNQSDRDREIYDYITSIPVRPGLGTSVVPPEGFDIGTFRAKQRELQVKLVFDEKSAANWPKYREQLMTEYGGSKMFEAYSAQVKAANSK